MMHFCFLAKIVSFQKVAQNLSSRLKRAIESRTQQHTISQFSSLEETGVADIPLGRNLRQASLELVSYTYDTFLFERRKLRHSMLLCTWLDRSFQTATKILGDFLKWHCFGQEAKVHHYHYDLYVFVKTCAVSINIISLV